MPNSDYPGQQINGNADAYRFGGAEGWTIADNGVEPSTGLDIRRYGMGCLIIENAADTIVTDTTMSFKASKQIDGTYYPVCDEDGELVVITFNTSDEEQVWYTIPARVMEHHFIKPLFGTSQTGGPLTIAFLGKT